MGTHAARILNAGYTTTERERGTSQRIIPRQVFVLVSECPRCAGKMTVLDVSGAMLPNASIKNIVERAYGVKDSKPKSRLDETD